MADAKSNAASLDSVEPLYHVKLLSALRSGDAAAIHPFLAEISKDHRKSVDGELDTGAAALHLAVRCGSPHTVALLLSHRAISPNGVHPPGSGTTPLHLAAALGRVDIVNLLLEQENINDGNRDSNGKSCKDVARNKDVVRAIDDSRSFLNASYRSLLRTYILSPANDTPSPTLISLLESPRVKFVDLSYLDDDSGASLLHEAAKRKDLRLIELAVRAGADVFVRNRKGKTAYECSGKDDRVRVFLRQFANQDKTLLPSPLPPTEAPFLKGYLNKYTNVAKGYNTRWFVLKDGILSYYRHQDDESVTSRGSISMKTAALRLSERTRFEVHSGPQRGHHHSSQKWYMKANHPVEAHRWTEAITKSIEWFKLKDSTGTDSDASSIHSPSTKHRKSGESDSSGIRTTPSLQSQTLSSTFWRKSAQSSRSDSLADSLGRLTPADTNTNIQAVHTEGANSGKYREHRDPSDDEDGYEAESMSGSDGESPPHDDVELHGNAVAAQLELTAHLLSNPGLFSDTNAQKSTQTREALKESLSTTQTLLTDYLHMTREREEWWSRQLKQEKARQHVWEESLAVVVKEGEDLEKELRTRSRRRGSRTFGQSAGGTVVLSPGKRASIMGLGTGGTAKAIPPIAERIFSPVPETTTASEPAITTPKTTVYPVPPILPPPITVPPPNVSSRVLPSRRGTLDTIVNEPLSISALDDYDTDEEDEFFDAIEANNLPNLLVHEGLTSPTTAAAGILTPRASTTDIPRAGSSFTPADLRSLALAKMGPTEGVSAEPYGGYSNLRTRLTIRDDERPSTSLWSVLKNSIGKDLTKISFPVHFNEPTSMLQRMAEDMEFSECLDVAAQERDPLRRIAFVAAFAMANYSSTIGRIAKPFNPMLSETFEYVRLDKQYRYLSEQVSHHPPISACWAESPLWNYYGEVDAQNKFMGKSFEIRPTGVAHADLLLPEDEAPDYPRAAGVAHKGKVVEHYSWKKVTTNISGFILGSPTIDHYGDMVITNHRTGDQCILTFKPRGWRGKDAYEISGKVIDAHGGLAYDIAGRWNSQLVAKQVGVGNGQLDPDIAVSEPNSPSASPEYILLWRNSEKIAGSPFNLTPFAITLNDLPNTLQPFLCPTDCRLRVDQRAFELGKYELANDLKQQQEEKQRSIRRAREDGSLNPHKPRWFVAETEPDTGDRVWSPLRADDHVPEYWVEREKVWKKGGKEPWNGVDDIFVEEPDIVKEMMANLRR